MNHPDNVDFNSEVCATAPDNAYASLDAPTDVTAPAPACTEANPETPISAGFTFPLFRDAPDAAAVGEPSDLVAAFKLGQAQAYTDASSAFEERLRVINDTHARLKAEKARLGLLRGQVRALLNALPYLDTSVPQGRFMADNVLSLDTSYESRSYLNLHMYRLKGFKDPRLTDVLEALVDAGWTCLPTYTDAGDTTIYRSYMFTFQPDGDKGMPLPGGQVYRPRSHRGYRAPLAMSFSVCAAVEVAEGTCRRVQVGETRKEVVTPVYEVICA